MNPRRILIFSLVYYPRFIGGAEVTIKEITDRISNSEIEFDMVTLHLDSSLPKYEKIGNVNVHRVGWAMKQKTSSDSLPWYLHLNKYAFLITGFLKANQLHRTRHYDAIWSLMATYNSFAALFFKLAHKNVKFIFTLQDGDPIPYIKRRALPLYPFFKMMFTRADHIQAISNYLADWAKDMKATCPITVIPNAVDCELFSKKISEQEAVSLKVKLGKGKDNIFLITTSRLVVKNAVGDVIKALPFLSKNIKFIILGQGYEEASLKELAIKLKLNSDQNNSSQDDLNKNISKQNNLNQNNSSNRVIFMGYIPHKDMPQYLQISDIFIRPALSEGLGNSFLEAMAAGIPVIGTPVGGIPDFLIDGETGIFCEVNNPRSIVQKVEKLIKDPESREYIVRKASEMVQDKYSWEKVTGEMKEIFVE